MLRSLLGSFTSRGLKLCFCCVFGCLVAAAHTHAQVTTNCCSYTVTNGGYALIATDFTNTLASAFPSVPGGSTATNSGTQLFEWNCQTGAFNEYYYKTTGPGGTGWRSTDTGQTVDAGTNTFLPGGGAILYNNTSTNYTYTICGTAYNSSGSPRSASPFCVSAAPIIW